MAARLEDRPIAVEGRNCWRRAHARRTAFLVDGAAYFAAFADAAARAERSLFILGWDIHSGIRLRRDGGRPELPLGDFLLGLLDRRPALHVNILSWDFAMIYALEREPHPMLRRSWRRHPRLHLRLDGSHPLGASHHQKVVVIDDAVAFVGGFDLTACRWDTPDHRAHDPRRLDPGYGHYRPFHDVQAIVDGEAAAAFGDLARERWRRATGARLPTSAPVGSDPWPSGLAPDVEDVLVAIARTEPAWRERPAVHEIEQLHLDAIASARRSIYFETQYVTSARLAAALVARLEEPDGPEIVLVVPRVCSGWLEEATMGALRSRLLRRLRDADRVGRLRVLYPAVPGLPADRHMNVHSKLLIVDDTLVRIGSANASSRSMRLDTECDLVLEADGTPRVREAIAGLRDRLLGEHLGVPAGRVAEMVERAGSLGRAIDALRDGERTLVPLDPTSTAWFTDVVAEAPLIDPEVPLPRHSVVMELLVGELSSARTFLVRTVAIVLGVLILGAAWQWTTLPHWIRAAAHAVAPVRTSPGTAVAVIAGFVAGGLLLVPTSGLIVGCALVFGPRLGFAYATLGSIASALVSYGLGRALSRGRVRRLLGGTLHAVSPRLTRRAVRAVITGRLVPIAPFTAVNLVAGAAGVDFPTFVLRTVLTLAAGTLLLTLLAHRLAETVRHPGAGTLAALLVVVFLVMLVGPIVRRRHWGARGLASQPMDDPEMIRR